MGRTTIWEASGKRKGQCPVQSRPCGSTLQAPHPFSLPKSPRLTWSKGTLQTNATAHAPRQALGRPSSAPASPAAHPPPRPPSHSWLRGLWRCEFSSSLILPDYPPFLQPRSLTAAFTVLSGFPLIPKLILMGSPLSCFLTFLSAQFLPVEYSSIRAVHSSSSPFWIHFKEAGASCTLKKWVSQRGSKKGNYTKICPIRLLIVKPRVLIDFD